MRPTFASRKAISPSGRRVVARPLALALFAAMLAAQQNGTAGPGTFERASVSSSGSQGNADSLAPTISSDGSRIAFQSLASNLDAGDTNGTWDVFLRNHNGTGNTALLSRGINGQSASGPSRAPSMAAPGPSIRVAFESDASNLIVGDTNGVTDVFFADPGMSRVSVSSTGAQANAPSLAPAVDGAGRFVAFQSFASNLVPGDTNGNFDVFVRDLANAKTVRVSASSTGTQAAGGGYDPAISPDGRYVGFVSGSPDLVAGDTNGVEDVFVHDRDADADGIYDEAGATSTERISVSSAGIEANDHSGSPSISMDGLTVAFTSLATNLVSSDTNGVQDVFVRSRPGAKTRRASIATDGTQGNGESRRPFIGAPGRYVVFESDASNLVATDANGVTDVFRRNVNAGITYRESEVPMGEPNGSSRAPVLSVAGDVLAWDSDATNLGNGISPLVQGDDTNRVPDVIVHVTKLLVEPDDPCADEEPPRELDGEVTLPSDAEDVVATDVDETRGSVASLYPDYDTTDASWYAEIECEWSIGGTVPDEAWNPDIDGELAKNGIDATMEQLAEELDLAEDKIKDWSDQNRDKSAMWDDLEPIGCEEDPIPVRPPFTPAPAPFPPVEPLDPEVPPVLSDPLPPLPANLKAIADRLGMPGEPPSTTAGPAAPNPCAPLPAVDESDLDPTKPFSGRDIIFVHGYRTDPLFEKLKGKAEAQAEWRKSKPADRPAFLDDTGYWRHGAIGYWQDHIDRWIDKPFAKNRYLVVAWPSTQWLPYGIHTTLWQISEAIRTGFNVVDPNGGTVAPGDFCRRTCVVVSHSAGGLVTDVSMTLSMLAKYWGPFRWIFGDISFIADRIKAHVALHPAILGSTYATLLVALGLALGPPLCPLATLIVNNILKGNFNCGSAVLGILESVSVDLATPVAHALWGGLVNLTPIPTLTVAGGHPTSLGADMAGGKAVLSLISHRLHLGFDDGVLTAGSQCGTPTHWAGRPSGFIAKFTAVDEALNASINGGVPTLVTGFTPITSKVYDMGIDAQRAIHSYIDQIGDRYLTLNPIVRATPYFSAAMCHPYLFPTGMVQPVLGTYPALPPGLGYYAGILPSPTERYGNHHSFLMSSSDHFWGPTLNSKADKVNPTPNTLCYEETNPSTANCLGNPVHEKLDNWEESMGWHQAIGESSIYPDLVNPSFGFLPEERVIGRKIEFNRKILGIKIKFKWWVWKRTYHRLSGAESKVENDYVYGYVLR